MEYEFTLTYKLDPNGADRDELVEHLGAAGCTDAMVGLGVTGHLGLEFVREAQSAEEAIFSALKDVRQAIPSATLVEAGPDLVGLSDVADLVGVTRQYMRKLMVAHAETFPPPVHSGSASIWHLALVLEFMAQRDYELVPSIFDVAKAAMQINIAKEASLVGEKRLRDVRHALAA